MSAITRIHEAEAARTPERRPKRHRGRLQRAIAKLESVLIPGERLHESVFQLRGRALLRRRVMVATTDRRILVFRRGLLGGFDVQDLQWQDLSDAHVKEHVLPRWLGADLLVAAQAGRRSLRVQGLESAGARRIYSFAQGQEQAWREKRRIRQMEELRAKSGGITLGADASGSRGRATSADVMEKLREAKALLDAGALSDVEYETLKARLLDAM